MKTSFVLVVAVMALAAAYTEASGTLGSGAMAATAASRVDSSAGSVMGPVESSNTTYNGPMKPGSIPTPTSGSADPDGAGGVAGGVAGGFETNATDSSAGSTTTATAGSNSSASNSSTTAPAATKSAGHAVASSVFTIVSVASTAAALAW